MLTELKVSNFAIINNIHLHFKKGFNVLSGETGAGKSVLLKSLALLMGEKSSTESIRTGSSNATIEGLFDLSERSDIKNFLQSMGIDVEDDLLVVRRLISQGDKSKVYLNGSLSTLTALRDIVAPLIEVTGHSAPLIEMTGQHESRHLMSKAYHLDLLDQYSGTWELRNKYSLLYESLQALNKELELLESADQLRAQKIDFLKYQKNEIASLDLTPGEENTIEIQLKKLKNAHKIIHFSEQAEEILYDDNDSVTHRINLVIKKSHEISSIDPEIGLKMERLEQAKTLMDDILFELRQHVAKVDSDPQKIEQLESRLSQLRKLQKKYGSTTQEILEALVKIEDELAEMENTDLKIVEIKKTITKTKLELKSLSEELHHLRIQGTKKLTRSVNEELSDLNMKGVQFHIQIEKFENFTSTGISDVEFMSQTSAKDIKRPLAKFASGGELSRILLSLKKIVGKNQFPRTFLFDEVDTGVSGETAQKVGRKLKAIAENQQVICVTHLPQVAAYGDIQFCIYKSNGKGLATMEVKELNTQDRINEIARLISGEKITSTSLAHAKELLKEVSTPVV